MFAYCTPKSKDCQGLCLSEMLRSTLFIAYIMDTPSRDLRVSKQTASGHRLWGSRHFTQSPHSPAKQRHVGPHGCLGFGVYAPCHVSCPRADGFEGRVLQSEMPGFEGVGFGARNVWPGRKSAGSTIFASQTMKNPSVDLTASRMVFFWWQAVLYDGLRVRLQS